MIEYCVTNLVPMAIGHAEDLHPAAGIRPGEKIPFIKEVCGFGDVHVVERRADGSVLVFLLGRGKCQIKEVIDTQTSFYVCESVVIEEDAMVTQKNFQQIQTLNKILAHWIGKHILDPAQRDLFLQGLSGAEEIVSAFCAYLVRDPDLQQEILEQNRISDKVEILYRLAESSEVGS